MAPGGIREEVAVALKIMKTGKEMRPRGIQLSVWKCMGEDGVHAFAEGLTQTLRVLQEEMPEECSAIEVRMLTRGHRLTYLGKLE